MNTKRHNIWIDNARIAAIFAVVFLHTSANVILNSDPGTGDWWTGTFYNVMTRWCVPVLVMISGALLLDPQKCESISLFYKKRAWKIIIPLIFWSVFYLSYSSLKQVVSGSTPSIDLILHKVLNGRPYYHMWFLYMILGLYVLTPFFRILERKLNQKQLICLVTFMLFLSASNCIHRTFFHGSSIIFMFQFLLYIPYFFLGHLLHQKVNLSKTLSLILIIFSFFATLLGRGIFIETHPAIARYVYDNLSISVMLMSIGMILLLKAWTHPLMNQAISRKISHLSFGVYLIHPFILDLIHHLGAGPMSFHPTISIPLIGVLIFIVSLGCSWVISQIPLIKRII